MEETISFLAHGLTSKRAVGPQSGHEPISLLRALVELILVELTSVGQFCMSNLYSEPIFEEPILVKPTLAK